MKRTSTRPGYADIKLFGVLWSVNNFHASRPDLRWITGIFTDVFDKHEPDDRARFFEVYVLGFGVGVCR